MDLHPISQRPAASSLFGHLNPDIFMVFSGPNRQLYARVIISVYREYFGTTFLRTPMRADVVAFIATELRRHAELWADQETLENLPDPPQRKGARRLRRKAATGEPADLLVTRANHVYGRLLRCGWIEEEPYGFNTRADMPPAAMALAEQLLLIETGLSQLFGGVVVEVRNALNAIERNPIEGALGLPKAADTAIGFVRRLRAIHSSLRGIERGIMESEDLNERLKTFFDDFIDRVLIQDFKAIMTVNHPYRFKSEILEAADRLSLDDVALHHVSRIYVQNQVEADEAAAWRTASGHLATIREVFDNVEEFFERIASFRIKLEARLRNTVRYMERSDTSIVGAIAETIKRLDALADRAALIQWKLPEFPTFLTDDVRPVSPESLAVPPVPREGVRPKPLQRTVRDPALQVLKELMRDFQARFRVPPDQVVRYLDGQMPRSGEMQARALRITSLDDLLAFDEARRYRSAAPPEFADRFEILPADGEHDDEWLRCRNFIVRRKPGNVTRLRGERK